MVRFIHIKTLGGHIMKKIISLILSVLMAISAFSVLGTTALADENAKKFGILMTYIIFVTI